MARLNPPLTPETPPLRLKTFRGPWKGQLLLACGKCQRKMKHTDDEHGLSRMKKALKHRTKADADPIRLRVITVPCLKICPKTGVALCTQAQLGLGRASIVRTGDDVDRLYAELKEDEAILTPPVL